MKFPREVGPPRKTVYSIEDYLKFVNLYNGKKNAIYYSIYSFNKIHESGKPDYNSAIVDKLFFDFDDKDCDAFHEVKKLHEYCLKNNIKHKINMSGRGYHCYIFTNIIHLNHTKETIYNAQHYFIDKLNLKLDTHVIGNPAQLARVPNTWNRKAVKFCIPLIKKLLDEGDGVIKQKALKQNFGKENIIGENVFEIDSFDFEPDGFEFDKEFSCVVDSQIENLNVKFPPCLIKIIREGNMRWKERYLIILYLKEKGYSKQNVFDVLNDICSNDKLNHCVNEERQLQYIFQRDDLIFPSCNKIKLDGYCPGKCEQYEKVVYK